MKTNLIISVTGLDVRSHTGWSTFRRDVRSKVQPIIASHGGQLEDVIVEISDAVIFCDHCNVLAKIHQDSTTKFAESLVKEVVSALLGERLKPAQVPKTILY